MENCQDNMSELIHIIPNLLSERLCTDTAITMLYQSMSNLNFTFEKHLPYVRGGIGLYTNLDSQFAKVAHDLTPKVKDILNLNIRVSSVYGRIYRSGAFLDEHLDKPTLDWTITTTLYTTLSKSWPIYVRDVDGTEVAFDNTVGDAILFKARELRHWRNELVTDPDEFSIHLFMHWEEI
jgi:hypothetical protein